MKHKLLFTWTIPHMDDYGLIDNDPEVIKATVCPMVKEITVSDIEDFIKLAQVPDDNGEVLIKEYKDCIQFLGFENHQSISSEKRSKSKYSKIPKISQENIGKNNIPQNSPVQVNLREVKLSKDNIREEKGAEALPPKISNSNFFALKGNQEKLEAYIATLSAKINAPPVFLIGEYYKFWVYWTELTPSGKKQRWETEKNL